MAHAVDTDSRNIIARDDSTKQPWPAKNNIGTVFLVGLGLAAALRLYGLGAEDFWLDEIHSIVTAAGRHTEFEALPHGVVLPGLRLFSEPVGQTGWHEVWRGMADDSHPPIYFLFFQSWRRFAGDGEFAARLPAAVFSILSLIPLALIFRELGKPRLGVWLVVGLAAAYAHIHMGQQCRPYSLGMLLVAISYWSFVRLQTKWATLATNARIVWVVIYGVSTYMAVMTHYFTAVAMAGQVVLAALCFRGALLRTWACTLVATILVFAVSWGPQLRAQYGSTTSQTWLLENHPDHVWRTLLRFADLPYRLLFMHEAYRLSVVRSALCLILLVVMVVRLRRHRQAEATVFAAWYLAAAGAFAVFDGLMGTQTLSHVRYISVLVPGLIGMIVPAMLGLSRRGGLLATAAFGVTVVFTLSLPTQDNPHNRTAAGLIAARTAPDTLLVFDAIGWPPFWASQTYHNVAHYLAQHSESANLPVLLLREEPNEALRTEIAEFARLVVVSPRVDAIPNPVPTRFQPVARTAHVHQIGRVYVFER